MRKLLGPSWYHRDRGPVYSFGGAFVDFLIRKYGTKKFLRLYNECRPESFEAVIRDIFEVDIDALEAEFWKDAMQQVSGTTKAKGIEGSIGLGGLLLMLSYSSLSSVIKHL